MGYTTTFKGELKFTSELNAKQLAKVKSFFGEDCRDHLEWGGEGSYIDLQLTDDFTGIQWDSGTEKNNGMVSHINVIIREMQKEMPGFGLSGQMIAQGEDPEDRWICKIENGFAVEKKVEIKGHKVKCPHCSETFFIETEE